MNYNKFSSLSNIGPHSFFYSSDFVGGISSKKFSSVNTSNVKILTHMGNSSLKIVPLGLCSSICFSDTGDTLRSAGPSLHTLI